MYVTRPLSLYKTNPDILSLPPPEGPNGGYLVLQDDESTPTCCFGLCKDPIIVDLPFPQNKLLEVFNASDESHDLVYLIPVINQPLSSNIYYAIKPKGKHEGEAYASSKEEDMVTSCFFNRTPKDVDPTVLDPADIYQQFKFSKDPKSGDLTATSIASDGYPPFFLRTRGWNLYSQSPKGLSLDEAAGLDLSRRACLPDFNFPLSFRASKPVVVGKWYCPFMFIRDLTLKDQVKKSLFYEITLEQVWERIFFCENEDAISSHDNKAVMVDITVSTESVKVVGIDAIQEHRENEGDTLVWFKSIDYRRDQSRVGLSSLVIERMMWEEERAGWAHKEGKEAKVLKREEFGGMGKWERYGCYMLVERFVLKRMDGAVVLTYSFNHTNQIRSKWE